MKTKRLVLRPFDLKDYSDWHASSAGSFSKKSRFDRGPLSKSESSRSAYRQRLGRYRRMAKDDHVYVFGAFERSSGRLIGVIDIFIVCRDILQQANICYRIFNLYWRKGFGKEALYAGIRMAFQKLDLNRVDAFIDLDNRISKKLAKRVGMKSEGIRRKCFYQDGKWIDQAIYSAQREDWGFAKIEVD